MRTRPVLLMALCMLPACASPPPPPAFLPRDVVLGASPQDADLQTWRSPTAKAQAWKAVFVEPVEMRVRVDDRKRAGALPLELQSNLRDFIKLPKAAGPGPGVLVVKSAITGARPDDPLVDLGVHQSSRGEGGFTSLQVYAVADGRPVAAMSRTIWSHKLTLDGDAAWGRAERALQQGAGEFASLLGVSAVAP
jgi:hypothetical protein